MGNPAECRINSLPEFILLHILCFLPIKAAVRCSILSKRWRYLYTSIPTVKFDEDDFREAVEQGSGHVNHQPQKANFFTVVDQFLLSHDSCLCRFSLDVTLGTETEKRQFGRWLRHLVMVKKVQELSISVDNADKSDKAYILPLNLLDCSSIHHLGMVACDFECRKDDLPMFPNLKSLSLGSVGFANDKICKLIRECPQLDSLTVENCLGITDDTHTIATNITSLKIVEPEFTNLETVTPFLKSFEFDCFSNGGIVKFIGDIDRVETLKACTCLFEAFYRVDNSVQRQFNELEVLIARPCSRSLRVEDILSFLRSSPTLRMLYIEDCWKLRCTGSGASHDFVACLLQQLQVANFISFTGKEAELMLLKYVLICAPSLQRLRLSFGLVEIPEMPIIAKELLWIQRRYPQLNIDFPLLQEMKRL